MSRYDGSDYYADPDSQVLPNNADIRDQPDLLAML